MRYILIFLLIYLGYVLFKKLVRYYILKKVREAEKQFHANTASGPGTRNSRRGGYNEKEIIDVEYQEVDDNNKKLN